MKMFFLVIVREVERISDIEFCQLSGAGQVRDKFSSCRLKFYHFMDYYYTD